MTQEINKQNASKQAKFWNRIQLLALAVVFLFPLVGAYFYTPSVFMNYGDLHTPVVKLSPIRLNVDQDGAFDSTELNGNWLFLTKVDGQCDAKCAKSVLNAQQLRLMQNQNMQRIRAVCIYTNLESTALTELMEQYPDVIFYRAPEKAYEKWAEQLRLPGLNDSLQSNRFYIVDPSGYLILSYPPEAEPKKIHEDIKRLLKAA